MVRRDLAANYLGAAWAGMMGLAFLPLYVGFLGAEAFGLIGAFAVLQGWFVLLDMGLSPTLNREMARFSVGGHTPQSIRNLLYTMEVIYLGIGLLLVLLVVSSADWLAANWFNAQQLSAATIEQALTIAAGIVGFRWMSTLYRSALLGLQRQVWLSIVNAVFATLRNAGVIGILAFFSSTIGAFFMYQMGVGLLEMLVLGAYMRRSLPTPPVKPVFSVAALRDVWEFAAGMMLITVLSTLLMQVDKLMLSTMLTLSQFGYFTLATTMAGVLSLLTGPIANVAYPRFSALVEQGRQQSLVEQYHAFSQLLSCLVLPTALILCCFASEVVFAWTGNAATAEAVAPMLSIWVVGNALNSLMHIPYLAQLAHGWSRLMVIVNSIAVAVIVPALFVLVPHYGAMAAAWVWVAINSGYFIFSIVAMHRSILRGEKWRWYRKDVLQPLLAGLLITALISTGKYYLPVGSRIFDLLFVCVAFLLALMATLLATSIGRNLLRSIMTHFSRA